jgi:hypothetical protein
MSISVTIGIHCDRCAQTQKAAFGATLTKRLVTTGLTEARRKGWAIVGKRHLCADCRRPGTARVGPKIPISDPDRSVQNGAR